MRATVERLTRVTSGDLTHRAPLAAKLDDLSWSIASASEALPQGLDTAAALPRLTDRMLERGISEDDIVKILGGNFLRAFEAIEKGARAS